MSTGNTIRYDDRTERIPGQTSSRAYAGLVIKFATEIVALNEELKRETEVVTSLKKRLEEATNAAESTKREADDKYARFQEIHDEYKIKMERIVQENANLQAEIERLKTGCLTAQSSTTTKLFASSLKQAQELSQTLLGQLDATQAELDEMKKAVQEAKKCEAERASDVSQEMQNIIETNTELENETKKLQQQLRVANRDRKELDGLLTTALGEVEKVIRETRETRMLLDDLPDPVEGDDEEAPSSNAPAPKASPFLSFLSII